MSIAWSPSRLRTGGWFVAPVAAALLLILSHDAPVVDVSGDEVLDAEFVAEDMRLPRVEERAALRGERAASYRSEAARLAGLGVASSPFATDGRYEHEPEVEFANPEVEPLALRLTSVMSASDGAMCVINQKVRRVGDPVGDGWHVETIEVDARSVTLEHSDGRTLVLAQR